MAEKSDVINALGLDAPRPGLAQLGVWREKHLEAAFNLWVAVWMAEDKFKMHEAFHTWSVHTHRHGKFVYV